MPSTDKVLPAGHTHLAILLHDKTLEEVPEDLKRVPIVVHPRDSVSKEYIANNIKSNLKEIDIPSEEVGSWRVEEEFINAIRGNEMIKLTTFEDGVRYMKFTEAVNRSMDEGRKEYIVNKLLPSD